MSYTSISCCSATRTDGRDGHYQFTALLLILALGAFDDEDIIHVEGNVDPVRDIEIIHEELRLKDEEMMMPIIDKLEKTAIRGNDKKLKPEYVCEVCACVRLCASVCPCPSSDLLLLASGHHVED